MKGIEREYLDYEIKLRKKNIIMGKKIELKTWYKKLEEELLSHIKSYIGCWISRSWNKNRY